MYIKFSKLFNFELIILSSIIINLILSANLPISINANAPHDDTLFYNLGYAFSNFNWLGDYNSGTFLKGPIFPIFIGLANILNIPYRLFEGILIVTSSLYFILALKKLGYDKLFLLLIFTFLIFYPFASSASNYRLLRENIYPWFLLLIFAEIIAIYINIKKNEELKILFFNSIKLGFYLFLFWNTREEGLFIIPGFIFAFFLLIVFYLKRVKKIILIFLISLFFLFSFNLVLKGINWHIYGYPVIVEFKDKNYIRGMNAFFRVKQDVNYEFAAPSQETWNKIFKFSKTAKKLEGFVFGPAYNAWAEMACTNLNISHWENHKFKKRYNCQNRMPAGFMLFAIRDAFLQIGLDSPRKISNFLNNIHLEIDNACNSKKLDCYKMPDILIHHETYSLKFLLETFKYLPLSIKTSLVLPFPAPNSIFANGNDNDLSSMSRNLKSTIFPIYKAPTENYLKKLNLNNENKKYFLTSQFLDKSAVDHVKYLKNGSLEIRGFVPGQILDEKKIMINIDNKVLCLPKIFFNSQKNISYFDCKISYLIKENEKIFIKAIYKDSDEKYKIIRNTENIKKLIINKFDESCYVQNNPDVELAINKNKIKSGYEHWLNYGMHEHRKCTPLYKKITKKKHKYEYTNYFLSKLSFKADYFYLKLFEFFYKILPLFMIFFIFFVYKKKDYFILCSFLIISSISFTRVFMLSIFHVNYMAPISTHYLLLSIFLNHLVLITIVSYVTNNLLKTFKKKILRKFI